MKPLHKPYSCVLSTSHFPSPQSLPHNHHYSSSLNPIKIFSPFLSSTQANTRRRPRFHATRASSPASTPSPSSTPSTASHPANYSSLSLPPTLFDYFSYSMYAKTGGNSRNTSERLTKGPNAIARDCEI